MFIISGNSPAVFEDFLADNGIDRYRGRQVLYWIYKKSVLEFSAFHNIPKKTIDFLKAECAVLSGEILRQAVSKKDKTNKFLIKLADGQLIESVLLYAGDGAECSNIRRRLTACLSTQAGCAIGCVFCASGRNGFKRNLTTSEIITQYLLMRRRALADGADITNIVFMGIGEPLSNYANLIGAIDILTDKATANMAARRLTVSTAGVVPAIDKLAAHKKQIKLSISLHSAFDRKRTLFVPLNKKYNIKALISAVKRYIAQTGRMVTFEYVIIKGINDTAEDALGLARILKGISCKINIIPYNPTENVNFKTPSYRDIKAFTDLLLKNKIRAIQRYRKGVDINSGCGQLKSAVFRKGSGLI